MLHNLVDIELPFRTVAYECHISDKHVPELRQLIQMMSPKPSAYPCQAWVGLTVGMTECRSCSAEDAEFDLIEPSSDWKFKDLRCR